MNYATIREHDPGGTIEEALEALTLKTKDVLLTESRVNVRTVADRYGLGAAESVRQVIVANFPAWVEALYLDIGLDVCSPGTYDQITSPPFTSEQVTKLLSFQTETRQMFQGIRYGDIEKARAEA